MMILISLILLTQDRPPFYNIVPFYKGKLTFII